VQLSEALEDADLALEERDGRQVIVEDTSAIEPPPEPAIPPPPGHGTAPSTSGAPTAPAAAATATTTPTVVPGSGR
jgi:hypothetical protein